MNPLSLLKALVAPVADFVKDTVHGDDRAKGKRLVLLAVSLVLATLATAEGGVIWWLEVGQYRFRPANTNQGGDDGRPHAHGPRGQFRYEVERRHGRPVTFLVDGQSGFRLEVKAVTPASPLEP